MKATGLKLLLLTLSLCFLFTGCFDGGDVHDVTPNISLSPAPTQEQLPAWQKDVFEQVTLFIQEGFRVYDVQGNYIAYFNAVEGNETEGICSILLEGETGLWEEKISFSYDSVKDRYTFFDGWEPVMKEDDTFEEREDSEFVVETRQSSVYKTEISQEKQFAISVRYQGEKGPVDHHEFWLDGDNHRDTDNYIVRPYIYSYLDDRLEFYATIGYPEISCEDKALEETINSNIQKELIGQIGKGNMYGEMTSRYRIKRADDMYFSIDCDEYYNTQWGAHPAEWPATLTINMETGTIVTLEEIVGEKWNLQTLLASGAFNWEQSWLQWDDMPEGWEDEVRKDASDNTLNDYNHKFYLTEDSLVLYVYHWHRDGYFPIEAKLSDLGLN